MACAPNPAMLDRTRLAAVATALVIGIASIATHAAAPPHQTRAARSHARKGPAKAAAQLPCGTVLDFQVRLDRSGFSPGEIDGALGDNFRHTVAAFQAAHNLEPSGNAECNTWAALGGDQAPASVTDYRLSDADVKGPFEAHIPTDLIAQAKLPALEYRSPLERIAEEFHAAPALLQKLNPRARFAAGETIKVPAVNAFDPDETVKPPADAPPEFAITVTKDDSSIRLTRPDGSLLFYAPVSSGSTHDPLPIGDWTVDFVKWHPEFHYNPTLFWDADPKDSKATIKPGPNNPVGVVWIALNLEHYGIHGTPEPHNVGHTQSHGCVRLTNWDAARVAAYVKKGTVVHFRESATAQSSVSRLRAE